MAPSQRHSYLTARTLSRGTKVTLVGGNPDGGDGEIRGPGPGTEVACQFEPGIDFGPGAAFRGERHQATWGDPVPPWVISHNSQLWMLDTGG